MYIYISLFPEKTSKTVDLYRGKACRFETKRRFEKRDSDVRSVWKKKKIPISFNSDHCIQRNPFHDGTRKIGQRRTGTFVFSARVDIFYRKLAEISLRVYTSDTRVPSVCIERFESSRKKIPKGSILFRSESHQRTIFFFVSRNLESRFIGGGSFTISTRATLKFDKPLLFQSAPFAASAIVRSANQRSRDS